MAAGNSRNTPRGVVEAESFQIKQEDTMQYTIETMTHEQKVEALRRELSNLRAELRKTKGSFKRSIIQDEIRGVCRELARLDNSF